MSSDSTQEMSSSENAMEGALVPRLQKQKPVGEEIPEDPAERKRVLNVLAQRRYRRRKKEQQAQLEILLRPYNSAERDRKSGSTGSNRSSNQPGSSLSSNAGSLSEIDEQSQPFDLNASEDSMPDVGRTNDAFAQPSTTYPSPFNWDSLDSAFTAFIDFPSDGQSVVANESDTQGSSESGGVDGPFSPDRWQSQLSNFLQNDEVQATTFADDFSIRVPELDILRASHTIAIRLHSVDRIWDPNAVSIFLSDASFDWSYLPENLRPTTVQLTMPHHPVLDLLPWPKMRTKLISMYATPSEFWPKHPVDNAEMSPFRLVCDLEEGGVRVWGADPTTAEAWEVEQNFVTHWWWAMDQDIIRVANQKRISRGEGCLRIGFLGT